MKEFLKFLLWAVGILTVLLIIGRFTVYETGEAPDNTVAPALWKGDKFLVWKPGTPDRGAIVYCSHPVLAGQMIIGRVVGVPGDTIQIMGNELTLNGEPLHVESEGELKYIDTVTSVNLIETPFNRKTQVIGGRTLDLIFTKNGIDNANLPETKVKGGYFLLGDNRNLQLGAADSRDFGEVHPSLCKGKVIFIYKAVKGLGDPDKERRMFDFLL